MSRTLSFHTHFSETTGAYLGGGFGGPGPPGSPRGRQKERKKGKEKKKRGEKRGKKRKRGNKKEKRKEGGSKKEKKKERKLNQYDENGHGEKNERGAMQFQVQAGATGMKTSGAPN